MRRSLVPAGLAVGFVNVYYPVITGFLILSLAKHGNAGPAAFSTYAAMVLFSRFFLGGLPDRVHPSITFYTGLVCMVAGLAILIDCARVCLGGRRRGAAGLWLLVSVGVDCIHGAAADSEWRTRVGGERAERVLRHVCRHQLGFRRIAC